MIIRLFTRSKYNRLLSRIFLIGCLFGVSLFAANRNAIAQSFGTFLPNIQSDSARDSDTTTILDLSKEIADLPAWRSLVLAFADAQIASSLVRTGHIVFSVAGIDGAQNIIEILCVGDPCPDTTETHPVALDALSSTTTRTRVTNLFADREISFIQDWAEEIDFYFVGRNDVSDISAGRVAAKEKITMTCGEAHCELELLLNGMKASSLPKLCTQNPDHSRCHIDQIDPTPTPTPTHTPPPSATPIHTASPTETPLPIPPTSGPIISDITTNIDQYTDNEVPRYEKLELTFDVHTIAQNLQLPYDPSPPNGIDLSYPGHNGISVDALFLPPGETNWSRAYRQPGFYYQYFDDQVKANREWYYPTGDFAWKVRFSPNKMGEWKFRVIAQDANGNAESPTGSFSVIPSEEKGFIKVSPTDSRYFEYDDGSIFQALGFNEVHGGYIDDPVSEYQSNFQKYADNKINLIRMWISSLYGASWIEWIGGRNIYEGYLPRSGVLPFRDTIQDRLTLAQMIAYEPDGDSGWFDACRMAFFHSSEAVKRNSTYRVRIKYWGYGISGPRNSSSPDFGFVAKFGGWHPDCYESNTGSVVTNYGHDSSDWAYVEGIWNSGDNDFLPRLHLAVENVNQGWVFVDSVSIQEELEDGSYGPNIVHESSMQYDLYFPDQSAHDMDKLLQLAEQNRIYLKLVISEKNDTIFSKVDDDGSFVQDGEEDNLDGFYGLGRTVNKTRWLQQAWWRYLQARWGYSPIIHSWELTNEGDPVSQAHYEMADEFGKYMKCRVFGITISNAPGEHCTYDHPNAHMITTSFWHSFPGAELWVNPVFPNIDYADVHAYVSTGWLDDPYHEIDAAAYHIDYSEDVRSNIDWHAAQNGTVTKPIIRGEAGIDFLERQEEPADIALDTEGVWLHNLTWAGLDPGALHELYWWQENLHTQLGPNGQPGLYEIYTPYGNFLQDIPLNNGYYQDALPEITNSDMRVVGQKDLTNGRAHLWIQNSNHTWRNVVDGASIPAISGTVSIAGFQPNASYTIEWWDTYQADSSLQITGTTVVTAQADGTITVAVNNLTQDVAVKISGLQGS